MKNYQGILEISVHNQLTHDIFEMVLIGEACKFVTVPGQFINIKINDSNEPFLRRPISVCDYTENSITIIYRVVGLGTGLLSKKKVGDKLDCLIGLGNGFDITHLYPNDKVLLVGGGVGNPPLYSLAKKLKEQGNYVISVHGHNTNSDVYYEKEFADVCDETYIALAEGGGKYHGFVTDLIREKGFQFDYYYSCGPMPMYRSLVGMFPVNGEISFEEHMGCGFGACMGCVCKTIVCDYKRVCKDGPVFKVEEVNIYE